MLKKLLIKNKKKYRFATKIKASERASQVNQATQAIQESQAKLVSQPKTENFCFFQKKHALKKSRKINRNVVFQKKLKSCSKSRISE